MVVQVNDLNKKEVNQVNIIGTSLYQIDHENNLVKERDALAEGNQLSEYISILLKSVVKSNSKREFSFTSNLTQVRASLDQMISNSFGNATKGNAVRLLEKERQAQEKISHLRSDIQRGSLFQALVQDESEKNIIICKADHEEILDEVDLQIRSGLPMRKGLYKAMLVKFSNDNQIKNVFVYDTNPSMAKYWWQDYLELSEIYTPSYNTERSLDIILKKGIEPLKDKYGEDYQVLRNSLVGYFRNQEEFDINQYVESELTNYTPIDPNLPKNRLIEKIIEFPEKHNFDIRFPVDNGSIKKRKITQKIKLADSIDLILNDYVDNIREIVSSETDQEGNKYLKIKTEEGYKWFTELTE